MEGGGGADRLRQRRLHPCVWIPFLSLGVRLTVGWLFGLFTNQNYVYHHHPPPHTTKPTHAHTHAHTGYLNGQGVPVAWAKTGVKFVHHEAEKYDLGMLGGWFGCVCAALLVGSVGLAP